MFPISFPVFVQYFRRVLKNVDNEQVRKPAICDVFIICLLFFLADKKLEKS